MRCGKPYISHEKNTKNIEGVHGYGSVKEARY